METNARASRIQLDVSKSTIIVEQTLRCGYSSICELVDLEQASWGQSKTPEHEQSGKQQPLSQRYQVHVAYEKEEAVFGCLGASEQLRVCCKHSHCRNSHSRVWRWRGRAIGADVTAEAGRGHSGALRVHSARNIARSSGGRKNNTSLLAWIQCAGKVDIFAQPG